MSDPRELQYLVHHLCLPPRLPQKDDSGPQHDLLLTKFVRTALLDYCNHLSETERSRWSVCVDALSALERFRPQDGQLHPEVVLETLRTMKPGG